MSLNLPAERHVAARVLEMLGRHLATHTAGIIDRGTHAATVPNRHHAPGIYAYQVVWRDDAVAGLFTRR